MRTKLLVGALALLLSGCYGPFRLTSKLYDWNGKVGDKWANELVFLGLNVIPVYGFALLADAIAFNSIEFWGGKNPVAKHLKRGKQTAVLTRHGDRLRIDSFVQDRNYSTIVIEKGLDGLRALDGEGRLLMATRASEGELLVTDPSGHVLARKSSKGLEVLVGQTERHY